MIPMEMALRVLRTRCLSWTIFFEEAAYLLAGKLRMSMMMETST